MQNSQIAAITNTNSNTDIKIITGFWIKDSDLVSMEKNSKIQFFPMIGIVLKNLQIKRTLYIRRDFHYCAFMHAIAVDCYNYNFVYSVSFQSDGFDRIAFDSHIL